MLIFNCDFEYLKAVDTITRQRDFVTGSYLSTCENFHGADCARPVTPTITGQRDLCGRILGIVIAHEITNETTRKTNLHDFISTSQDLDQTTCK